jgi:hypothetical protein
MGRQIRQSRIGDGERTVPFGWRSEDRAGSTGGGGTWWSTVVNGGGLMSGG